MHYATKIAAEVCWLLDGHLHTFDPTTSSKTPSDELLVEGLATRR
jgi:hypothetical protein